MTEAVKCPLGIDPTELATSIGELTGTVRGLQEQIVPLRGELRDTDAHVNQLNGRFDQFLSDAHREGGKAGSRAGAKWAAIIGGITGVVLIVGQICNAWSAIAVAFGLP